MGDVDLNTLWLDISKALVETTTMVGISLVLALLLGLPLGFGVFLTRRGMLWENRLLNWVGGIGINLIRSLPFVILLILVLPLAQLITGRSTGPYAASVPLAIASIAFFARLVESALCEVSRGVIEAARAHGASDWLLIRHVLYPESRAGLLRGFTVTAISLIGYSAMAGVVGGGGIGFLAINYGYYRYETGVMIVTVAILIVIVQIMQSVGDYISNRLDHKK
jgi:D-methionine transport system permease protein